MTRNGNCKCCNAVRRLSFCNGTLGVYGWICNFCKLDLFEMLIEASSKYLEEFESEK